MGRAADAAAVGQWRQRITRQRRSGLSIAAFCRRERVSQPSFFNWRKRLETPHADATRPGRQLTVKLRRRPPFVQLPAPDWAALPGVQIALPTGAVVTLPSHATAELVATAIRAAMQKPSAAVEDSSC